MQLTNEQRAFGIADIAPLITTDLGDTITLADGRKLGYAEFGDPQGFPLLHFHGACASRLEGAMFAQGAAAHGIRLIALDRPGMGLSSPLDEHSFLAWPGDVLALADQLGFTQFAVAGQSGGGGYACACGVDPRLHGRLKAVVMLCGMLPATAAEKKDQYSSAAWLLDSAAKHPRLCSWVVKLVGWMMASSERKGRLSTMPDATDLDKEIAGMPGIARIFATMVQSGLIQGGAAAVKDMAPYGQELGFKLEDIVVPVLCFHGERDRNVPFALAQRVAGSAVQGRLIAYPEVGHLFGAKFADHIMQEIAACLGECP